MKKIILGIYLILNLIFLISCMMTVVVSFDTGLGSTVPDQNVEKGGYATRPIKDPTLEGYIFDDWYEDSDYINIYKFESKVVLKDITIYAKWNLVTYDNGEEVILEEEELSFKFLYENSNSDANSPGYGLTKDRSGNLSLASIASTGFALASLPIGIENDWISYQEGYDRALGTLNTIDGMEKTHGFYYHFVSINTGKRMGTSEVSVIDTAIMICGVLVVGKYFGGEVEVLSKKIYESVEWGWYINPSTNLYYMTYDPEKGTHAGAWDRNNEQLMLYFLGAGSPTYPTQDTPYNAVKSIINTKKKGYTSKKDSSQRVSSFFINWDGPLFTHQYSHAFLDFRNIVDRDGTNWFNNAVQATKAQILYAYDMSDTYKTLNLNSWGLSACDGPQGYKAYGSLPCEGTNRMDGTVCPYAAIASINYTKEDSLRAAAYFKTHDNLWGEYGFKASYNLGRYDGNGVVKTPWYASDYVGIDKGITVLMIENYRSNLIWDIFMDIDYIKDAIEALNFSQVV